MKIEPFKECPRYAGCSVNRCPLDPGCNHMPIHSDDKEKQCPMENGVGSGLVPSIPTSSR